jgi:hypothetical protein
MNASIGGSTGSITTGVALMTLDEFLVMTLSEIGQGCSAKLPTR